MGQPTWRAETRAGVDPSRVRDLRNLLIFVIAYSLAYKYGMTLSVQTGAPFWFPDPVLLCALLLSPPGRWWVYLAAALPVRLFTAVTPSMPVWFLLLAFANDSLKGLAAAYLVRRTVGRDLRFDTLRDLWKYCGAAVLLAPALSGAAGAAAWSALGHNFLPTWRQWFLGDAIANLVCTPLLLCLARDWRKLAAARGVRYVEGVVLFSVLPFAAWFAYQRGIGSAGLVDPFGYIPLPLLVWAAVRFGPAGASGALSILSILSVAAAGASPSGGAAAVDRTLSIQLFMVVLAVPIMSLSVLVEQQRKTEESLRESEERFRNMADSAPVMIWIAGEDGRATFFNRVWLDFTGRALEQELGHGWTEGLHPDHLEDYRKRLSAALDNRLHFRMEYRLSRADGEYRWILSSGVPRFAPGGAFAGYIASCVDITDLKHAQEEVLARQKLESLGVLTGGIAHDFNNLLGGIHALAELATAELQAGSSPVEEIERIRSVASRGSEIVRELMIYSGQDKADLEPLDVSQLVKDTMELLGVSISKHAVLRTDLQPDLPLVRGSAPRIRQVVMNLIINASEAIGEKDGVITLATSRVTAGPEGDHVRLVVSDTGCGMTAAAQARIFDPFFTTKFAGRGMGLAVVQGIIRDHGGVINLDSTPGEGTTFEILLPCAGKTAESSPASIAPDPARERVPLSGTVLVVEDEGALRLAVSTMLRKRGFWVIEATDGASALELVHTHKNDIDVMLLDITLPGVSSREVLEQARGLRPDLRVILTSAYSRETVASSLTDHRVDGFLRKPFLFVDLIELLQDELTA